MGPFTDPRGGGHCRRMCTPQQDQFLSFSHTFSPKSVHIGGWCPPNGLAAPQREILDPPLVSACVHVCVGSREEGVSVWCETSQFVRSRNRHQFSKIGINIHKNTHDMSDTLADFGGLLGARLPPYGPNSSVFAYIFTKKHPRQRSTRLPRVYAPYGKSWIRHCDIGFIRKPANTSLYNVKVRLH